MSVIVAAHVRDGIVLASDTRTTVKDGNGNTMYKDDAIKIVAFPNRMAVAHCGDASLGSILTVNEFLYKCRDRFGCDCRVFDLPSKLLYEYNKLNVNADVVFYVAGYGMRGMNACIYKVCTKDSTITLSWSDFKYGASFGGLRDIVYEMMRGADYKNMSLSGCKRLVVSAVNSTILSFEYCNPQSVGGHCDMYVLGVNDEDTGWIKENVVEKDVHAPDDAYDLLMSERVRQMIAQHSVADDVGQSTGNGL